MEIEFSFDFDDLLIERITDAVGKEMLLEYDDENVQRISYPNGAVDDIEFTYGYDPYTFEDRVIEVDRGYGAWTYECNVTADPAQQCVASGGDRVVVITDPDSNETVVKLDTTSTLLKSIEDPLSRTVSYQYDAEDRVTRITQPEGNYTQYTYDSRGNVTQVTEKAKSGSGLSDIVTSAVYPASCSNPVTCNKPTSTTDARSKTTNYTYSSTHGGVTSVKSPAGAGGIRPETRHTYASKQARYKDSASTYVNGSAVYVLIEESSCATSASCDAGADETIKTIAFPTTSSPNNLLPLSITSAAGNSAVTSTFAFTYDDIGNVETVDGPLSGAADTTRYYYTDIRELRAVIGPDPDAGGALKYRASLYSYNADGLLSQVEIGTGSSQADDATFSKIARTRYIYDDYGRKRFVAVDDGSETVSVTQYVYDNFGRPECVISRMNPDDYATLTYSCALDTEGAFGADRIVKSIYDNAGQVTKTISGYGTSLQQDTVTTTYTTNGLVETVTDANGNKTTYEYDGFDRLVKIRYPHPASTGASSTTDYEQFTYDANGNVLTERRRDGQTFSYTYDDLSRLTNVNAPGSQPDITTVFDNFNRITSVSQTGHAVTFSYDQLSRLKTQVSPLGMVSYTYDDAGRRTRMNWPGGYYVNYDYNTAGDLLKIRENGASSGAGVLATYGYDDLGRRTSMERGNGISSAYTYDAASRLLSLAHDVVSGDDENFGFFYAPSFQMVQRTSASGAYDWLPNVSATDSYAANGLNQLTSAGGITPSYDSRGNLTGDGTNTYGFDADNRLISSTDSGVTASLAYDPLGQLYEISATGTGTSRFLYDGADLIAEYDGSGTLLRRYVHGPGVDEPLVWLEGTGTSDRRWLLSDERGSVIAVANVSGAVTAKNIYDDYGTPLSGNTGRFQYTGQLWIGEGGLNLYHYKARAYSPHLGRFLQTDPIGYEGGMNLYAYVQNDPVNFVDPTGLQAHYYGPDLYVGEQALSSGQLASAGYPAGGELVFGGSGSIYYQYPLTDAFGVGSIDVTSAFSPMAVGPYSVGYLSGLSLDIFSSRCGFECSGRAEDASYIYDIAAVGVGLAKGLISAGARAALAPASKQTSSIVAANGTEITGYTRHGLNRAIGDGGKRAGVGPQSILNSLRNPRKFTEGVDSRGRPFQIFQGETSRVVVNPNTGQIVSVNPLSGAGVR